jgi:hypothetical protein
MSLVARNLLLSSLILSLSACTTNDVVLGGAGTIARIDSEPAGARCPDGGAAIHLGYDQDEDLYLDDEEIQSTHLVCTGTRPVQCAGGTVVTSRIVNGADDLAALAGVHCIDGDLQVTGVDGAVPALADLGIITGDLIIASNSSPDVLASFGALREVGDDILIQGNDGLVDLTGLGSLQRAAQIAVTGNRSLVDLTGLDHLTHFGGAITVTSNPSLVSVDGLDQLVTSSGQISLRANRSLTSIDALASLREIVLLEISGNMNLPAVSLPALERVEVRLIINENPAITSVSAPVLTTTGGFIQMESNAALRSIDLPRLAATAALRMTGNVSLVTLSVPQLAYMTGDLQLISLPALTTLGLGALTAIGGSLDLHGLSSSAPLAGLSALDSIGGNLVLRMNRGMVDVSGLSSLASVSGDLTVTANPDLASFAGLDALRRVDGAVTITSNPSLLTATAQSFADALEIGATVTITGNR